MTVNHLYPTTRPTLDLNFARQKRLDPRVTFTRGSTATYVGDDGLIKTAASNEARFDHDPATGESLGLLIEESRTNNFKYSEDFSQTASYSLIANGDGQTPVLDGTLYEAPDGSLTAQRWTLQITDTTDAGNQSGIQATATGIPASAYVTVWAKSATGADQTVFLTSQSNDTFTVTSEWQRFNLGQRGTIPFRVFARGTYTAATVDVLVWGAQAETGSFPTSYIPTSGSTVTRSADVASMTGTNFSSWYNQSEGSFFVNSTHKISRSPFVVQDANLGFPFITLNENTYVLRVYASGASAQADINTSVNPLGTANIVAGAFKANDFAVSVNGNSVLTDTSGSLPTFDILRLGKRWDGAGMSGHISRLTYYPTRLTDSQLQELTR